MGEIGPLAKVGEYVRHMQHKGNTCGNIGLVCRVAEVRGTSDILVIIHGMRCHWATGDYEILSSDEAAFYILAGGDDR